MLCVKTIIETMIIILHCVFGQENSKTSETEISCGRLNGIAMARNYISDQYLYQCDNLYIK